MEKNIGKIYNTEVLEKIALSEHLPPFHQQHRGTEVLLFIQRKIVSVYDDYSVYPEADAKKWRVKPYSRSTGRFHDRLCMQNGLYPSRKRAIEEVRRFQDRGEDLIFYVLPVQFSCNLKKLLWPESDLHSEQGVADLSEQQAEAKKRLLFLTGRNRIKDIDLAKKYKNMIQETAINAFFETLTDSEAKPLPYVMLGFGTILYVGSNKSDWPAERACMGVDYGENGDGCAPGYVYNFSCPVLSEYGDVFYRYRNGSLYRCA